MACSRWPRILAVVLLATCLCVTTGAHATVMKGWVEIEDNGFADTASLSWGVVGVDYELWGWPTVPATVQEALTGPDLTKGIHVYYDSFDITMEMGFTDNVVTNDPGFDLAIFTTDAWSSFRVAVKPVGASLSDYLFCSASNWTFDEGGLPQYTTLVDLEDFGLAAGQPIDAMSFTYKTKAVKKKSAWTADEPKVKMDYYGPSGVGAVSAVVPEATTLTILGAGLLATLRKRRRKRADARPPQ